MSDARRPPDDDPAAVERALRWRLVLGQFADEHLPLEALSEAAGDLFDADSGSLAHDARPLDDALNHIYDRAFAQRSHRSASPMGADTLNIPRWLSSVRTLFPREAAHVVEQDALHRFGMTELVTDPEILRNTAPTDDLLRAIMQFKHMMTPEVLTVAREVVATVVAQLRERLLRDCATSLHGVSEPQRQGPQRSWRNLDFRRTIQRNLKNYNVERGQIVVDRLTFRHRQQRRRSHRIIVAVDQSGSMTDSLIHSAVMAAIFAGLPAVDVHLVLWDHRVMDLSGLADDPVEVLMAAQLGGGTRLLPAMQHCAGLITEPERTIFVILSDWYLWSEEQPCLALAEELAENGVIGIGLNALDADCRPTYNERFARDLAGAGWFVATLTPKELAAHVARIIG